MATGELTYVRQLEAAAELAGDVAHDLNNVLTIIIGYTDLIRRRATGDAETCGLCETILSAARQATDLSGQLLAISRPERGEEASELVTTQEATLAGADHARTVLLVDDDAQVRALGRDILERDGYRVVEADGAASALGVLEQLGREVDLLLTDIAMPAMTGEQLAKQARETVPGLPVLFLSGYPDGPDGVTDRLGESIAYLGKPFCSVELRRGVRELLDFSAARSDNQRPAPS
jgi:CheY-like chemotaxis protein